MPCLVSPASVGWPPTILMPLISEMSGNEIGRVLGPMPVGCGTVQPVCNTDSCPIETKAIYDVI